MNKNFYIFLLLLPSFLFSQNGIQVAQSENYGLRWPSQKEWWRTGIALGTVGSSLLFYSEIAAIPNSSQIQKSANRTNWVGTIRKDWATTSDLLLIGTAALPAIYALASSGENDKISWAVGYGEALCYTFAITHFAKALISAPRPYSSTLTVDQLDQRSGSSFFSGHAAFGSAAATYFFLTAKDLGLSKKTLWWTVGTGMLATSVATIRVVSRSHFPEDVIVGAAVGAGTSILIRKLTKNKNSHLSLSPNFLGGGTLSFTINF